MAPDSEIFLCLLNWQVDFKPLDYQEVQELRDCEWFPEAGLFLLSHWGPSSLGGFFFFLFFWPCPSHLARSWFPHYRLNPCEGSERVKAASDPEGMLYLPPSCVSSRAELWFLRLKLSQAGLYLPSDRGFLTNSCSPQTWSF